MSEMIDRVARIVASACGCGDPDTAKSEAGFPCPFCSWPEDAKEESGCMFWAEKIITAMREPTEAMTKAGDEAASNCFSLEPGEGLDCDQGDAVWQAMVDEALKP